MRINKMSIVSLAVLSSLLALASAQSFELQFIGDYVSDEEVSVRDYCESKYCLHDGEILFAAASQNFSIEPCNDFKEFALGQFIKYRALNDRRRKNGFMLDVEAAHSERQRKVLSEKVKEDDALVVKVTKNYFAKCVDSRYAKLNGTQDNLDLLRYFGISVYPESDQSKFSMSELFAKEPTIALLHFFKRRVRRCKHPNDESKEILCLSFFTWGEPEAWFASYANMLYDMNNVHLNSSHLERFVADFKKIEKQSYAFYKLQDESIANSSTASKIFKVKDLRTLASTLDIDWVKLINHHLLRRSFISQDDEIWVEKPEEIKHLHELISMTDQAVLAEYFGYNFLYTTSRTFFVYNHDKWTEKKFGRKKSPQRWEQCLLFIQDFLSPSLEFMYSHRYQDEAVSDLVTKFSREAVQMVTKIIANKGSINDTMKQDVVNRLKSMKYVVGVREEILDSKKIEKFYGDLGLTGNEAQVEMFLKIDNHHEKIENELRESWRRKLDRISMDTEVEYFIDDNFLLIPSLYVRYPFYHNERPRFFNTATLFVNVAGALLTSVTAHLKSHWKIKQIYLGDDIQLSYNNYAEWIKKGGKDLQLGANRLTNEQLYWMAVARRSFEKYRFDVPATFQPRLRLFNEYLHVILKENTGFQESFNCSMTEEETAKLAEYNDKMLKLKQMS